MTKVRQLGKYIPCKQLPPAGRLSVSLYYNDAAAAIEWLCAAFGFSCRLRVEGEGGRIEHSELVFGEAVVMASQSGVKPGWPRGLSPLDAGGNTQNLMLYVDGVDAHFARASAMPGAKVIREPQLDDYGADYWADRAYGLLDPEGHFWWISERIRNPGAAQ